MTRKRNPRRTRAKRTKPEPKVALLSGSDQNALAAAEVKIPTSKTVLAITDEFQVRADVQICLLKAVEEAYKLDPSDVGTDWKPDDIGSDIGAWRICLEQFQKILKSMPDRPHYVAYEDQPRFAEETFDNRFGETVTYLNDRVIESME